MQLLGSAIASFKLCTLLMSYPAVYKQPLPCKVTQQRLSSTTSTENFWAKAEHQGCSPRSRRGQKFTSGSCGPYLMYLHVQETFAQAPTDSAEGHTPTQNLSHSLKITVLPDQYCSASPMLMVMQPGLGLSGVHCPWSASAAVVSLPGRTSRPPTSACISVETISAVVSEHGGRQTCQLTPGMMAAWTWLLCCQARTRGQVTLYSEDA